MLLEKLKSLGYIVSEVNPAVISICRRDTAYTDDNGRVVYQGVLYNTTTHRVVGIIDSLRIDKMSDIINDIGKVC